MNIYQKTTTQDYSKTSKHSRSLKQSIHLKLLNHFRSLNQLNQSIQLKLHNLIRSTNQKYQPRWRQQQEHLVMMKTLAVGEALNLSLKTPETSTEKERNLKDGGER